MSNLTNASPAPNSVTLPTDGPTNVWMYAVIAAATLFVIFLAVACYTMSEFFNKGPRPRRKDDQQSTSPGAGAGVEFMPNHIQPGTTMLAMPELDSRAGTCTMAVADPDIDSKSVTSIDRTPPNSVRAPACVKLDATSAVRNVPAAMPTVQHMHPSPFSACLHLCRRKSSGDDSFEFQVSNMHELAPLEKNGHGQNNPHAHVQYCVSTLDQPPAYDKTDRPLNWDNNHDETETKLGWSDQESGTGLDHVDAAKVKKMNQANPVKKPERTETCVVRLNDDNLIETQLVAKSHDFESANINASTNGSVIPGQDGGGICSLGNSPSHQNASIVYLNREASDSDPELATVPEMGHRDSFAMMLDTLLDKRLTVNPIDLTVDDDLEAAGETDRLIDAQGPKEMAETSQRISQRQEDTKPDCVQALTTPLLGKHKKTNKKSTKSPKPPMLINLKSQSLEQAEHVRSKRFDSDDDSIGNAGSLMSHSSTMSRISKLSMSLGPSIKIDPDEARSYNGKDMQTAMSPHRLKKQTSSLPTNRKGNISYLTYSSVDTETSEDAPSSSISCDSLSPRSETTSEQNQTQSQTPTLNRLKHKNTDSDNKSFRNVAIGSLQRDRDTQKTLLKSDDDSGTDSLNGQGSLPSRTGTKLEGVVSPVKVNGTGSDGLKSPYYYQDTRNKRAILRKQAGSEIDE